MQRWPIFTIMFGIMVVLSGCNQAEQPYLGAIPRAETVELPTAIINEPTPLNTLVLSDIASTPKATGTPIPDEVMGTVVEVIDGDTVKVVLEGDTFSRSYQVRYVGIDALPRSRANPWGVVAYEKNRELTALKVVRLVRDEDGLEVDAEGNLLRYVYMGQTLVNLSMVEEGLAEVVATELTTDLVNTFKTAEDAAKSINLGRWGSAPTPTTAPQLRPTNTAVSTQLDITTSTPRPTITGTLTITN